MKTTREAEPPFFAAKISLRVRDESELVLTLLVVIPVWPDLEAQFIPPIFQAALSRLQRCLPKWVRFHWTFVEYKEQNGFVVAHFALAGTGYNVDCGYGSQTQTKVTVDVGNRLLTTWI